MKNNMEEIDKLIKETLTEEESKFYDELDEQGLFEIFGGMFQGKLKWLMILMNIIQAIAFISAIYCAVQFFSVDATNDMMRWGMGTGFFLMVSGMLKLFAWMQFEKNAILREIKRVELQISILAGKDN